MQIGEKYRNLSLQRSCELAHDAAIDARIPDA